MTGTPEPGDVLQRLSLDPPGWLRDPGEPEGIHLGTRVRLTRNLSGRAFPQHADLRDQETALETIRSAATGIPAFQAAAWLPYRELTESDRRLLAERDLASPALTEGVGPRGVFVGPGEVFSVMVNEEDHLRVQVVVSGLGLERAWDRLDGLDDDLAHGLEFAWHEAFGFLTSSPTEVGTGLRAGVLMHLPALTLTDDAEAVLRAAGGMGMDVEGVYGGVTAWGNLYHISNQMTLGRSEADVLTAVGRIVTQVADYERRARVTLSREARLETEDRVHRALGMLRSARLLSSRECLNLISLVRLGLNMNVLSDVQVHRLNRLQVLMLPAHLDRREGRELDPDERDRLRAEAVRSELDVVGGG